MQMGRNGFKPSELMPFEGTFSNKWYKVPTMTTSQPLGGTTYIQALFKLVSYVPEVPLPLMGRTGTDIQVCPLPNLTPWLPHSLLETLVSASFWVIKILLLDCWSHSGNRLWFAAFQVRLRSPVLGRGFRFHCRCCPRTVSQETCQKTSATAQSSCLHFESSPRHSSKACKGKPLLWLTATSSQARDIYGLALPEDFSGYKNWELELSPFRVARSQSRCCCWWQGSPRIHLKARMIWW